MSKGLIIVVSGFSGVGKGTVLQYLVKLKPLKFSVSCTTRAMRKGEADGVNYYFISEEEFERRIEANEFVEYTRTFTNYYGTLRSEIDESVNEGKDVLLELNVVGAKNIKKLYPDAVAIFIEPPSYADLKKRLIGRGSETEDSIERRLNEIEKESKEIVNYDYLVTNNIAKTCAEEIAEIINSEHHRVARMDIENLFKSED